MAEILGEALEFDLGSGVVMVPSEACPVASVNGKIGNVVLDWNDVGALPDTATVSDLPNDAEYQTKEELDAALAGKQDNLIAGENIALSGRVISAHVDESKIAEETSAWLSENLSEATGVVDASLTVSGAAADAKVTGDELSLLKAEKDALYHTADSGLAHPDPAKFVSGVLNYATGEIVYTSKYCAVLKEIETAETDMYICVPQGFVIRKFLYPGGEYAASPSLVWESAIEIFTGETFRFEIRKDPYDQAEIANVQALTAVAQYDTQLNVRLNTLQDTIVRGGTGIPLRYWRNGIIDPETGENYSSGYQYRAFTSAMQKYPKDVTLIPKRGYLIRVIFYGPTGGYTPYNFASSSYDYTTKAVLVPADTNFKVVVKKSSEDTATTADLEEFSAAVTVLDSAAARAIYESGKFHTNPRNYYALKKWIDAILRPQKLVGNGMPVPYVNDLDRDYYPDGYNAGYYLPGTNYSTGFPQDRDIYFNAGLASWISMLKNPASRIYKETWTWNKDNNNFSAYFGAVCSTFVSYLLGQDIFYKACEYYASAVEGTAEEKLSWASQRTMIPSWLENDVFDWKDVQSIYDLEIGDIYSKDGHVALIADVGCDDEGYYVTVFEQYKPDARIVRYSNTGFMRRMTTENGKICRFKNNHHIRDPREIDLEYCETCIPDRGDKSVYYLHADLNLYVPSGAATVRRKRVDLENQSWETLTPTATESVSGGGVVYTLPSPVTAGDYLYSVDGGETYSQVSYVDVGSVIATADGSATCVDYQNCTPLWAMAVCLSRPFSDGPIDPDKYDDPEEKAAEMQRLRYYVYHYNGDPYSAVGYYGTKRLTDGPRVNIEAPYLNLSKNGWYVRVQYKTKFGQVHCDSNLILPAV